MKIYITVNDILTSSGKYPERATHPDALMKLKLTPLSFAMPLTLFLLI